MTSQTIYDVVIIGGGVSGFGAAIYAGRFFMKVAIITERRGGTIALTDNVENYPGFKQVTGLELVNKIEEHMKSYKVKTLEGKVKEIMRCGKHCFRILVNKRYITTKTIVFATGTEVKKLGVQGEEKYKGLGVHYCAICDGPLYKNKVVAVVGGSDSAAKEALFLTEYAKKVYIIYRGGKIRAEPINYRRLYKNKKIEVITKTEVKEIRGNGSVSSVILSKPYKKSIELDVNALFIEIGHTPLSELARKIGVKLNDKDEIIIDKFSQTNVEGVFAAGDVTDTKFKQAITGVAQGVTAVYYAYHYVNENELICVCNDED